MNFPDYLLLIPDSPIPSLLVWLVIISVVLYMARKPAHEAILSASRILANAFRLASFSILAAKKRLRARNKEVLLAEGKAANERIVEREFERINISVTKNLSTFPSLQRKISETVSEVDKDYRNSAEVPPEPPGWAKVIEPIAKIPAVEDSMVAEVLKSIRTALESGQEKILAAYRQNSKERHLQLKMIAPNLRHIEKGLGEVNLHIKSLLERSASIDNHMETYEELSKSSKSAEQRLSSSSLTQFFISGFVLAIAIGGAFINFNLIARPMQEMVGGAVHMMGFRVADVAALVIILVEVSMGLFLMESLRITRLFPIIGALDDKVRVRMIVVSFVFLFLLASIEAGLAYMRELLSQDDAALIAGLLSDGTTQAADLSGRWITTAAQMGMGFVLPFALTFVAIPLESFFYSFRTVLGMLFVGLLHLTAGVLRLLSNLCRYGGKCLVSVYDLLIFLPLWIERKINRLGRSENVLESGGGKGPSYSTSAIKDATDMASSVKKRLPRKTTTRSRAKKESLPSSGQTQEVLS